MTATLAWLSPLDPRPRPHFFFRTSKPKKKTEPQKHPGAPRDQEVQQIPQAPHRAQGDQVEGTRWGKNRWRWPFCLERRLRKRGVFSEFYPKLELFLFFFFLQIKKEPKFCRYYNLYWRGGRRGSRRSRERQAARCRERERERQGERERKGREGRRKRERRKERKRKVFFQKI